MISRRVGVCIGGILGQLCGQSFSSQLVWPVLIQGMTLGVSSPQLRVHLTSNVIYTISSDNVTVGILVAEMGIQLTTVHFQDLFILIFLIEKMFDGVLQVLFVSVWTDALVKTEFLPSMHDMTAGNDMTCLAQQTADGFIGHMRAAEESSQFCLECSLVGLVTSGDAPCLEIALECALFTYDIVFLFKLFDGLEYGQTVFADPLPDVFFVILQACDGIHHVGIQLVNGVGRRMLVSLAKGEGAAPRLGQKPDQSAKREK